MTGAMKPVVTEIVGDKRERPSPPHVSDFEDRKLVDEGEYSEHHGLGKQSDNDVADAHGEAGRSVFKLVEIAAKKRAEYGFEEQQAQKCRDRVNDDEIGHGRRW